MTDIVERLRMDADDANPYRIDQDGIMEAADTIDALRQRIKELEEKESSELFLVRRLVALQREELAALKQQGEQPEVWVRDSGDSHWEFSSPGNGVPLYKAPPTCFSAADMADAQAEAARVEREECAKVCENLFLAQGLQNHTQTLCAKTIRSRK